MTPLHIAAIRGYDEMTNLLLRRGAQTDVKNYTQMRAPLHFACQYNHPRVRYSENGTVLRNQGGSPSEEIVSSLRPNLSSFFTINSELHNFNFTSPRVALKKEGRPLADLIIVKTCTEKSLSLSVAYIMARLKTAMASWAPSLNVIIL